MSGSSPKLDTSAAPPHGTITASDSLPTGTAVADRRDEHTRQSNYSQGLRPPALSSRAGPGRSSPDSASRTPSRAFGFQSILNPANPPEDSTATTYRLNSPAPGHHEHGGQGPRIASPRSRKRVEPASPTATHSSVNLSPGRLGRRILTPKSPGLRAASLGARRYHSDVHDRYQQPPTFDRDDRVYTASPGPHQGSEIPPMPLPPLALVMGATLPPPVGVPPRGEPPTSFPRHTASMPPQPQPAGPPGGYRPDSPHSTASSYTRTERASPIFRYRTSPTETRFGASQSQLPPSTRNDGAVSAGPSRAYGPTSAGHGLYESFQQGPSSYLNLSTEEGPMIVPVELDLQQASKVADEKRKRNAGASARFRARRKEKEKEAITLIQELQQELNDARDDRDFYVNERNFFRDLARRNLGHNHIPPRPTSPPTRIRRALTAPSESADDGFSGSETGPGVHRRPTGDWQQPFPPAQSTPSSATSAYGHHYPHRGPALPLPPAPIQGTYQEGPRTSHGPAPPTLQSASRPLPYDPFRPTTYDSSWKPSTSA